MIESFPTYTAANTWIAEHPEWKPVSIIPGIGSGSVMVLFEAKCHERVGAVLAPELYMRLNDAPIEIDGPKRRGRPPKVKDA